MQIKKYRSSFSVLICDNDESRANELLDILQSYEYVCRSVIDQDSLMNSIFDEPPHVLVLNASIQNLVSKKSLAELKQNLPETHFIIINPEAGQNEILDLYDFGLAFAVIHYPLRYSEELLHMVDRAATLSLKDFQNEGLKEELQLLKEAQNTEAEIFAVESVEQPKSLVGTEKILNLGSENLTQYYKHLSNTVSFKAAVQVYTNYVADNGQNQNVLFFKYIPGYQSLVLSYARGLNIDDYRGVGIELSGQKGFSESLMKTVKEIEVFKKMISDVFSIHDYYVEELFCQGKFKGVFVCFGAQTNNESRFVVERLLFQKQIEVLLVNEKLHRVDHTDAITHVLNRQTLMQRLSEEVSRARRTQLPVSFILISIDDFSNMLSEQTSENLERLLKNVGTILTRNSRVNDIIGRVGSDEFGIILPHTSKRGAAIKAERIRKIIERADFSKIIKDRPKLTLSVGASEYPSLSNDADDLVMTADEALYQIKSTGSNKVCMATPKDNFQPDFTIKES